MDTTKLLQDLYAELADIERQQQDKTLPHSDQQLMDQAWEDVTNRIDALEQSFEAYQAYLDEKETDPWRDAAAYLAELSQETDTRTPTPPPASPPRLQTWVREDGAVMTGIPPSVAVPTARPPPKATFRICNCDSDGVCEDCKDRMQEDCRFCSGCHYCRAEPGYDGADEI